MSVPLSRLEVLVVDCQSTAAAPRGQLLEVAWARVRGEASGEPFVESHLVAPARPLRLLPRIQRLTGLTPAALRSAAPLACVGVQLDSVCTELAASSGVRPAVAVAHFARFEEPFLHLLLGQPETPPLELLCTHALARRLLPSLPRLGLRSVAGYLGHATPELVALLAREQGIHCLQALREWHAREATRRRERRYPLDPGLRRRLPAGPGVYRFRRKGGSVLYVGASSSLRRRVSSYFQTTRGHEERTLEMLAQARELDYTPTRSALEAALLEPDEIKRLAPPYNLALREGDRRLGYWSWSLRHVAPVPDERHPIGPLPQRSPRPPLRALLELLDAPGEPQLAERLAPSVLAVPRRYAPRLPCFRAGLALFLRRHERRLGGRLDGRTLLGLAARLRRGGPRAGTSRGSEEPDDGASRLPHERWTPESVAGGLESVVVQGAHAIGRSRWLCALSECSVAWRPSEAEAGPRYCLELSRGLVTARRELADLEAIPPPAGHAKPRGERRRDVDLAAYDRLSALSRELKRLVAVSPSVGICLGPARALDRNALAAALAWL
jgi:DNA polymerase-3 subunit epsilon